jgi:hypothetical protein
VEFCLGVQGIWSWDLIRNNNLDPMECFDLGKILLLKLRVLVPVLGSGWKYGWVGTFFFFWFMYDDDP